MPSWKLHDRWALKIGIPEEISREVNRLIDSGGRHDLGRSGRRGGIGPIEVIITTGPRDLLELLEEEFPDDFETALKASALHHLLDRIERMVKEAGYEHIEISPELIEIAYDGIKSKLLKEYSHALVCDNATKIFIDVLKSVKNELLPMSNELTRDIIEEVRRGRKAEPCGPLYIAKILKKISVYGIITVDNKPLPLIAAAQKIYSKLRKKSPVRVNIRTKKGFESLKLSRIEDLLLYAEKIQK
ncbi:MAG: hypothetical protein ACTSR0_06405 [Candidatus Asgardarchaeia archaeon]